MIDILPTTDNELLADLNEGVQNLHNRLCPALFKPYHRQEITSEFRQILRDPMSKRLSFIRTIYW